MQAKARVLRCGCAFWTQTCHLEKACANQEQSPLGWNHHVAWRPTWSGKIPAARYTRAHACLYTPKIKIAPARSLPKKETHLTSVSGAVCFREGNILSGWASPQVQLSIRFEIHLDQNKLVNVWIKSTSRQNDNKCVKTDVILNRSSGYRTGKIYIYTISHIFILLKAGHALSASHASFSTSLMTTRIGW